MSGSVDDIDTVVDADFHVTDNQSAILPYLDDPFGRMLAGGAQGEDAYEGFGSFYPTPGFFTPIDTGKIRVETVTAPADVREGVDLLGLDRAVLNPTRNLALSFVHHDELAMALANAYTDWLLDTFLDEVPEAYGSALVAPHDPHGAAEEIDDRAGEGDIVAAFLPGSGVTPELGHRWYYPIYEACEDNGLPLLIHNGANGVLTKFPFHFMGSSRYTEVHVPSHPSENMFHLTSLLVHGVPERFPDLEFVLQESGIGWIPFFIRRFEHEFNARREDAPALEPPVRDYIDDQFYFTSQPVEGTAEPEYVEQVVRFFNGERNLLFSSDYPHHDFDTSDELLSALRAGFDDAVVDDIYGRTALSVFAF